MKKFQLEEVTYSVDGYRPDFKIIDSSVVIENKEREDGSIAYLHGLSEDEANSIISALDRQMPVKMKTDKIFDGFSKTYVERVTCPICDNYYTSVRFEIEKERIFKEHECVKYCLECGQRLDWERG